MILFNIQSTCNFICWRGHKRVC